MARLKIWGERVAADPKIGIHEPFYTWHWSVIGANGREVLQDDGRDWRACLDLGIAHLVAVSIVESRGHSLRPWSELVDDAAI